MSSLALLVLALHGATLSDWLGGEAATSDWGGFRSELADHGLTLDLAYTGEGFLVFPRGQGCLLGHADLALTLDTGKAGLWKGGTFYVLAQDGVGQGVGALIGASTEVSNLEARQFAQFAEFFFEQSLFDGIVRIRLGKQDANRDFGTPRYGGNLINNNFGMFPNVELPSFPAPGLGATAIVEPTQWLAIKAAIYEGDPQIGSFGFDSALAPGAGYVAAVGLALKHVFGEDKRHGGTTSAGFWRHSDGNLGVMVQHDQRIYSHPSDPNDGRGLNVILRFSWSRPELSDVPLYFGASLAWHGLWSRDNDTVGAGFGYLSVSQPLGGSAGPRGEVFFEAFYKMRLTHFFSLQPDAQLYLTPGGDGTPAFAIGLRTKLKL
jgi:porin